MNSIKRTIERITDKIRNNCDPYVNNPSNKHIRNGC